MAAAAINPRLLPGGDVYQADVAAGRTPWIEQLTATKAGRIKRAVLDEMVARASTTGRMPDPADVAEDIDVDLTDEEIAEVNAEAKAQSAGASLIIPGNAIVTPFGTVAVTTTTVVAASAVLAIGILALRARMR